MDFNVKKIFKPIKRNDAKKLWYHWVFCKLFGHQQAIKKPAFDPQAQAYIAKYECSFCGDIWYEASKGQVTLRVK